MRSKGVWASITSAASYTYVPLHLCEDAAVTFFLAAPATTLCQMEERQVLEAAHDRLAEIIMRVKSRLDDLSADIARDGQMIEGSKKQRVAHPLLRIEKDLRVELRRASSDRTACETRLASLGSLPLRPPADHMLGRNPRRTHRRT